MLPVRAFVCKNRRLYRFFRSALIVFVPGCSAFAGSISYSTKWLLDGNYAESRKTPINPENALLQIPTTDFGSELRPNIDIGMSRRFSVFLAPRFQVRDIRGESEGEDFEITQIDSHWNQLYLNYRVTRRLQVTYGIQNYKWGPSDWIGPSNVHSDESGFTSNLVFETDGTESLRVNADFGRSVSLVVFVDTDKDLDAKQKATVKIEYSPVTLAAYIGASVSAAENEPSSGGLYASAEVLPGLSLYTDALVSEAKSRRTLSLGSRGPSLQGFDSRYRVNAFGLVGFSYTFVGGQLLRAEYIHNTDGLDQSEWSEVSETVDSFAATGPLVLADQVSSRYNLLGQQYVYVSSLFPDFGPQDRFRFVTRSLVSLQDRSSRHAVNLESFLTDFSEFFLSVLFSMEGSESLPELGTDLEYAVSSGFLYSW